MPGRAGARWSLDSLGRWELVESSIGLLRQVRAEIP